MKAITLALDAATYAGTVAVLRDGAVIAECETRMRGVREERLMPAVAGALREARVEAREIGRVVCGSGPGSFTSLRIAASIAKGIAVAARATLHPVSSLLLMVGGARPPLAPGRYAAVLDAMRGEAFVGLFSVGDGTVHAESDVVIVARHEVDAFARAARARAVGPDEAIAASPHARGAAALGRTTAWPPAADLAAWEPDYGRRAEAQVRWEAAHGRALGLR